MLSSDPSANVRRSIYRWLGRAALSLPGIQEWARKRDDRFRPSEPVFWKSPPFAQQALLAGRAHPPSLAWFHAASAGELEALWPVIQKWKSDPGRDAVVSILSPSAEKGLARLDAEMRSLGQPLRGVAFSPLEGQWKEALARVEPAIFVTFKYEAWPDLWASLAELDIPLAILGARARSSLKVGKLAMSALGSPVPRLALLSSSANEISALRESFQGARIECVGEPRWDRVAARARTGSERAKELIVAAGSAARPWGVLGSAWIEDIRVLGNRLAEIPGRLWVVPHDVEPASIAAFEVELAKLGLRPTRTSRITALEPQAKGCFLVDEMGVLAELYSAMDWVYVGGGFTKGVHSTIEPALFGLPIAIGPKNAHKFSEIAELEQTGQLRVFRSEQDLNSWATELAHQLKDPAFAAQRDQWKRDAARRLGASDRALAELLRHASGKAR